MIVKKIIFGNFMHLNLDKFTLVSHFKWGNDVIKQYAICYGLNPNDKTPEDIVIFNDDIIFHKKGWNTDVFSFIEKYCGFELIGWNREKGYYLYKCEKVVQELEIPNKSIPQYWRKEKFA